MERMGMSRSRIPALLSAGLLAGLLAGCIDESPIAFSPDGKTVAFVTVEPYRTGDGGFAVGAQAFRLMVVDEQRKVRVLESATDMMLSAPGFSPDGQRLAYLRVPLPTGDAAERQRKDLDERIKSLQKIANPTWMAWVVGQPEGAATQVAVPEMQDQGLPPLKGMYVATALMMVSPNVTATLVVRDVRGGAVVSTTPVELPTSSPAYTSIQPQFDPAGKCVYVAAGNLVMAVDPASGQGRVLAAGGSSARLSPDGRMLAMAADDVVGLVAADGGMAVYRRLPSAAADAPSWIDARTVAVPQNKANVQPTATQSATTQPAAASQPATTQPSGPAVVVVQRVRTDGTLLEPVEIAMEGAPSGGTVDQMALAPDGRHVAISVSNTVVFATMDGKAVKCVEVPEMRLQQPTFSPDSRRVAVKVLATTGDKMVRTAAIAFYSTEGKELDRVAVPAVEAAATQGAATDPAKSATLALDSWHSETGTVNVKIVDEAGKPVAGVKIQANGLRTKVDSGTHWRWGPDQAIPPTQVLTNAEGAAPVIYPKYVGKKLEVGYITFQATHPGYCPGASYSYAVDGNSEVVLKTGATLTVAGYVGDTANTVPVKVQVTNTEAPLEDSAWQDVGNNVRMTHELSAGKHYVRLVQLPRDAPPRFSEAVVLEAEAGSEYRLRLEIRSGVRVEGKLDASVPRPIRNGWIIADAGPVAPDMDKEARRAWREWERIVPSWEVEVPIAKDGTFVLPSVPAGQVQLVGLCEGYLSKSPALAHSLGAVNPQSFLISGQTAPAELMMEPSANCQVRVVDEQGQPVEGARVEFCPNYRINGGAAVLAPMGFSSENLLRGKIKDPMEAWQNLRSPYMAATNSDGIATIKGLPGTRESFSVTHDKYELPTHPSYGDLRSRDAQADLASGKTTTVNVTVQVKGKDSLAGPVVGEKGS